MNTGKRREQNSRPHRGRKDGSKPSDRREEKGAGQSERVEIDRSELEKLLSEAAAARENREKMLRTLAEMENLRKRLDKEKKEYISYANQELLNEILPVLDNFDRALASAGNNPEAASYLQGVEMIYKQLEEVLRRQGLEEIKARGEPFDPFLHEAVQQELSDDCPDGTILEVLLKGYLFRGKLLRPAAVKVASNPAEDQEREAG